MKPFVPLPELKAFFDALEAASLRGLIWGDIPGRFQYVAYVLPPVPATPTDPIQRAFLEGVCLPTYHSMVAANQRAQETIARARGASGVTGTIGQLAAAAEAGDPAAQAAYEQMLWQQASSGAP